MRLGMPTCRPFQTPAEWIQELQRLGCSAAYCPIESHQSAEVVRAYAQAALAADIVIAEVGAWSNPLSADPQQARDALLHCQQQLALAETIGARCCVNIAGSCGESWDGPHPANLTAATFDRIVQTVRTIIDAVRPTRTFYVLETMPWMYPDSPASYLRLIQAIDRPQFAVHLDPVNLIASPQQFFATADLLHECFATLGPYIKSCHAKDITLRSTLTVHLDEVRPGLGGLDYGVFLRELAQLDPDAPLLLEHLPTEEEYQLGAAYIRATAATEGVLLHDVPGR